MKTMTRTRTLSVRETALCGLFAALIAAGAAGTVGRHRAVGAVGRGAAAGCGGAAGRAAGGGAAGGPPAPAAAPGV